MAQLFPPDPPPATPGRRAERALWEALRAELPEDVFVYYSTSYLSDRAEEGEVDFLLLHRELGMLVLECKGHGVTRKNNGAWVRVYQGTETPMESPFDQAQGQMHALRRELETRIEGRLPFVYGYAVAFPLARARDLTLPLDVRPEIVLTADTLGSLRTWFTNVMTFWRAASGHAPTPLSSQELKRFRKQVLHPELRLIETVGARLKIESASLAQLTDEQILVLKSCLSGRRLRVSGGAGTGKTSLALEAAKRFAKDPSASVLVLCFNRMLAGHLAATVGSWGKIGGTIDVTTFHALCRRAFDALGKPYAPPEGDRSKQFWEQDACETLFEALGTGALPRYDAVVVDEGQDFAADWYSVLEECLKDAKTSRLVVFDDPAQSIFGRSPSLSSFPAGPQLTINFRNTRAITDTVQKLGRIEMEPHPRAPAGEPPAVHEHEGPSKTRAWADDLVRRLVEKDGVDPEQITVLTPHRRENSSLKGVTQLGGLALADAVDARAGKVLHTTIGAFKGLESDVVILLDVDPRDARCDRRARYVAASRAKLALHVVKRGDWMAD